MRNSFTSSLPAENKAGIIEQIKKYTNIKCGVVYDHFDKRDELYVYLVDNTSELQATLIFSDRGVKLASLLNNDLVIDVAGLDALWKDELIENYGTKYEQVLSKFQSEEQKLDAQF